tara:strand:+ start:195 stop:452 length:258 start_codon:yes stop_codon:yes gene_type:complete
MCFGRAPRTPTPPPLAPAPPPPLPPRAPTPEPEPLIQDVDPEVKKQESKKEKNPAAKGTSALRIPLASAGLNLGTSTGNSLNIPK